MVMKTFVRFSGVEVHSFSRQKSGVSSFAWQSNKVILFTSLVAQMVKKSACNTGDLSSIPGLGRSPEERNGYPFQYSCLGNPMDRGAWRATVHEVAKSRAQMNDFHFSSLPKSLSLGFNSVPIYREAEISVTQPSHSPQK